MTEKIRDQQQQQPPQLDTATVSGCGWLAGWLALVEWHGIARPLSSL